MRKLGILSAALVCASLAACGDDPTTQATHAPSSEKDITSRAQALLQRMSMEEKVGQIIQADISSVTPEDLKTYNLGSVLNGGNSAPGNGKVAPAEAWIALADSFWVASTDTSDGGVGIPALWGTDAVHGHNNLQTATIFPHNSALGATHDPELMKRVGDVTAQEIRATGLDWTFAPTLAVARDDRWGRAYESYSENPDIVAAYSAAIIEGLQGKPGDADFLVGDNVMATAKHFLGDGGTQFGVDKGDTVGDLNDIIALHGAGYRPAMQANVQTVMASFSSINGEKMHGSHKMLTDVLRGDLGFEGFVVGDWNGHAEVPGCTATDCPEALAAGLDMYMAPDSWKGLYESLVDQAQNGKLDLERLDEAVLRILKVKIRSGLLDAGLPSKRPTSDVNNLGKPEHRAVAREAVRKSLVLLKNENAVLPVQPGTSVLVTGNGADSMQQQTGGWTLNWQGTGNANSEFFTGETILSGIKQAVGEVGGTVTYAPDGQFSEKPDVAIVVFGEQPYAEYLGDRTDLVFEFSDGENLKRIRDLKAQGIKVVSVFLTGRPLWVNPHLNASDAFVVAWLPGSEGAGVADVLVSDANGAPRYPFQGQLSFSWPADGKGTPINSPEDQGVLFPFGFGLTYDSSDATLAQLSEDPGVGNSTGSFSGLVLRRGQAPSGLTAYLGDSSNGNLPVQSIALKSLGGGIEIHGIDYKAQEDARQLDWSGNGKAVFGIKSQRALDLSKLGDPDKLVLAVNWNADVEPSESVSLVMGCGEGCSADVDVTAPLSNLAAGQWTETRVPLSCFIANGLNPLNVTNAFGISSSNAVSIALHSVSIEANKNPTISCQ